MLLMLLLLLLMLKLLLLVLLLPQLLYTAAAAAAAGDAAVAAADAVKCPRCGYVWKPKSKKMYVMCPSCFKRVKLADAAATAAADAKTAATAADAKTAAAAAAATIASTDQLLGELNQLKRRWLQVFTSWLKKNPKALSREHLRDFERLLSMFVESKAITVEEYDNLMKELVEAGVPLPSYTAVREAQSQGEGMEVKAAKTSRRITIRDVIAKRKVQLLSEVKPHDAQQFIKSAKEQGVIVLEGERDVLLADPDFYQAFFEKLPSLPLEPKFEDEAEEKLFKFLVENGLIYRDAEKGWQPVK